VSVAPWPATTDIGLAISETTGGGVTLIVVERVTVPPSLVQASVNRVSAVSAGVDSEPTVGFAPLQPPLAVHVAAVLADHERVALPPGGTDVALVLSVNEGGSTEAALTFTVRVIDPPAPLQVSVKLVVACSGPVDSVPLTGRSPLQPLLATQFEA